MSLTRLVEQLGTLADRMVTVAESYRRASPPSLAEARTLLETAHSSAVELRRRLDVTSGERGLTVPELNNFAELLAFANELESVAHRWRELARELTDGRVVGPERLVRAKHRAAVAVRSLAEGAVAAELPPPLGRAGGIRKVLLLPRDQAEPILEVVDAVCSELSVFLELLAGRPELWEEAPSLRALTPIPPDIAVVATPAFDEVPADSPAEAAGLDETPETATDVEGDAGSPPLLASTEPGEVPALQQGEPPPEAPLIAPVQSTVPIARERRKPSSRKRLAHAPARSDAAERQAVEAEPTPVGADLESFAAFVGSHAVDRRGRPVPAPWRAPAWEPTLRLALEDAVGRAHLGRALLFARALGDDGDVPDPARRTLEALVDLLGDPGSANAGTDPLRAEWIRAQSRTLSDVATWSLRLALVLESMRPNATFPLTTDDAAGALYVADYDVPEIATVVQFLLDQRTLGYEEPSLRLRLPRALRSEPQAVASVDELGEALILTRHRFHNVVADMSDTRKSPKVEQTFCRNAWKDAYEKYLRPLDEALRPHDGVGSDPLPDSDRTRQWVTEMLADGARLMDRAHVRFEERNRVNRRFRMIADAAVAVAEARGALDRAVAARSASAPAVAAAEALPEDIAAALDGLARREGEGGWVGLAAAAICCQAGPGRAARPDIGQVDLEVEERAGFARLFVSADGETPSALDADGIGAATRHAAAWLLDAPSQEAPGPVEPELGVAAGASRLRRDAEALEALAEPGRAMRARLMAKSLDELQEQLAGAPASFLLRPDIGVTRRLVAEWASSLQSEVHGWSARAEERLEASAPATARPAVRKALDEHRFLDAIRLVDEGAAVPAARAFRVTRWRCQALHEEQFAARAIAPRAVHAKQKEERELLDSWRVFLDKWPLKQAQTFASRLRDALFVNAPTDDALADLRAQRYDQRGYRIGRDSLRHLLRETNPCFLPQIHAYDALVLLVPRGRLLNSGDVEAALAEVDEERNALVVLVAPGTNRRQVRQQVRTARPYAIIDDLDLLRLLDVSPVYTSRLVGLLEICLEQQPLDTVDPFEVGHGRYGKIEMFVGRGHVAQRIATNDAIVQVFSGRKLGKSALLSYVEERYDLHVSGGRRLRIAYVDITGEHEEALVVRLVVEAVAELYPDLGGAAEHCVLRMQEQVAPVTAYGDFLGDWARAWPDDDLLILLDEADSFIEREIGRTDGEGTLSWRMRRGVPGSGSPKPRVRHVVAGYRCADTTAGAWGNWGTVENLQPLEPAEATELFAAPFARVGVDASEIAPLVAWWCTHQPALVLHFGRMVFERVRPRWTKQVRDAGTQQVLTLADFEELRRLPAVEAELRRIVMMNFAQDPAAEIIFRAFLLCLRDAGATMGVAEAEEEIVLRLANTGEDVLWLGPDDESRRQRVARELARIASGRNLLREQSMRYYLRFPHWLELLSERGGEEALAEAIRSMRGRLGEEALHLTSGLVAHAEMTALRGLPADRPRVVVCAGDWRAPRLEVADRLGVRQAAAASSRVKDDLLPDLAEGMFDELAKGAGLHVWTGGMPLLRWAADRFVGNETHGHLVGALRVPARVVRWWLRHRRHAQLPPEAHEQIRARTAGVPILLHLLDEALEDEADLASSDLSAIWRDFEERRPAWLRQHLLGQDGLLPREVELLRIAALASEVGTPGSGIHLDLEAAAAILGLPAPRVQAPEDQLGWRVLILAGLLYVDGETTTAEVLDARDPASLAKVPRADDPLLLIARALDLGGS